MSSKSKRCSRSCHEMLLTYSVGMESSASRQAVTAQQKESAWSPIQEESLRLFIEFFQKANVFHFRVLQVVDLSDLSGANTGGVLCHAPYSSLPICLSEVRIRSTLPQSLHPTSGTGNTRNRSDNRSHISEEKLTGRSVA